MLFGRGFGRRRRTSAVEKAHARRATPHLDIARIAGHPDRSKRVFTLFEHCCTWSCVRTSGVRRAQSGRISSTRRDAKTNASREGRLALSFFHPLLLLLSQRLKSCATLA